MQKKSYELLKKLEETLEKNQQNNNNNTVNNVDDDTLDFSQGEIQTSDLERIRKVISDNNHQNYQVIKLGLATTNLRPEEQAKQLIETLKTLVSGDTNQRKTLELNLSQIGSGGMPIIEQGMLEVLQCNKRFATITLSNVKLDPILSTLPTLFPEKEQQFTQLTLQNQNKISLKLIASQSFEMDVSQLSSKGKEQLPQVITSLSKANVTQITLRNYTPKPEFLADAHALISQNQNLTIKVIQEASWGLTGTSPEEVLFEATSSALTLDVKAIEFSELETLLSADTPQEITLKNCGKWKASTLLSFIKGITPPKKLTLCSDAKQPILTIDMKQDSATMIIDYKKLPITPAQLQEILKQKKFKTIHITPVTNLTTCINDEVLSTLYENFTQVDAGLSEIVISNDRAEPVLSITSQTLLINAESLINDKHSKNKEKIDQLLTLNRPQKTLCHYKPTTDLLNTISGTVSDPSTQENPAPSSQIMLILDAKAFPGKMDEFKNFLAKNPTIREITLKNCTWSDTSTALSLMDHIGNASVLKKLTLLSDTGQPILAVDATSNPSAVTIDCTKFPMTANLLNIFLNKDQFNNVYLKSTKKLNDCIDHETLVKICNLFNKTDSQLLHEIIIEDANGKTLLAFSKNPETECAFHANDLGVTPIGFLGILDIAKQTKTKKLHITDYLPTFDFLRKAESICKEQETSIQIGQKQPLLTMTQEKLSIDLNGINTLQKTQFDLKIAEFIQTNPNFQTIELNNFDWRDKDLNAIKSLISSVTAKSPLKHLTLQQKGEVIFHYDADAKRLVINHALLLLNKDVLTLLLKQDIFKEIIINHCSDLNIYLDSTIITAPDSNKAEETLTKAILKNGKKLVINDAKNHLLLNINADDSSVTVNAKDLTEEQTKNALPTLVASAQTVNISNYEPTRAFLEAVEAEITPNENNNNPNFTATLKSADNASVLSAKSDTRELFIDIKPLKKLLSLTPQTQLDIPRFLQSTKQFQTLTLQNFELDNLLSEETFLKLPDILKDESTLQTLIIQNTGSVPLIKITKANGNQSIEIDAHALSEKSRKTLPDFIKKVNGKDLMLTLRNYTTPPLSFFEEMASACQSGGIKTITIDSNQRCLVDSASKALFIDIEALTVNQKIFTDFLLQNNFFETLTVKGLEVNSDLFKQLSKFVHEKTCVKTLILQNKASETILTATSTTLEIQGNHLSSSNKSCLYVLLQEASAHRYKNITLHNVDPNADFLKNLSGYLNVTTDPLPEVIIQNKDNIAINANPLCVTIHAEYLGTTACQNLHELFSAPSTFQTITIDGYSPDVKLIGALSTFVSNNYVSLKKLNVVSNVKDAKPLEVAENGLIENLYKNSVLNTFNLPFSEITTNKITQHIKNNIAYSEQQALLNSWLENKMDNDIAAAEAINALLNLAINQYPPYCFAESALLGIIGLDSTVTLSSIINDEKQPSLAALGIKELTPKTALVLAEILKRRTTPMVSINLEGLTIDQGSITVLISALTHREEKSKNTVTQIKLPTLTNLDEEEEDALTKFLTENKNTQIEHVPTIKNQDAANQYVRRYRDDNQTPFCYSLEMERCLAAGDYENAETQCRLIYPDSHDQVTAIADLYHRIGLILKKSQNSSAISWIEKIFTLETAPETKQVIVTQACQQLIEYAKSYQANGQDSEVNQCLAILLQHSAGQAEIITAYIEFVRRYYASAKYSTAKSCLNGLFQYSNVVKPENMAEACTLYLVIINKEAGNFVTQEIRAYEEILAEALNQQVSNQPSRKNSLTKQTQKAPRKQPQKKTRPTTPQLPVQLHLLCCTKLLELAHSPKNLAPIDLPLVLNFLMAHKEINDPLAVALLMLAKLKTKEPKILIAIYSKIADAANEVSQNYLEEAGNKLLMLVNDFLKVSGTKEEEDEATHEASTCIEAIKKITSFSKDNTFLKLQDTLAARKHNIQERISLWTSALTSPNSDERTKSDARIALRKLVKTKLSEDQEDKDTEKSIIQGLYPTDWTIQRVALHLEIASEQPDTSTKMKHYDRALLCYTQARSTSNTEFTANEIKQLRDLSAIFLANKAYTKAEECLVTCYSAIVDTGSAEVPTTLRTELLKLYQDILDQEEKNFAQPKLLDQHFKKAIKQCEFLKTTEDSANYIETKKKTEHRLYRYYLNLGNHYSLNNNIEDMQLALAAYQNIPSECTDPHILEDKQTYIRNATRALSSLYLAENNADKAEKCLETDKQLDEERRTLSYELSTLFRKKGHYLKAETWLKQSFKDENCDACKEAINTLLFEKVQKTDDITSKGDVYEAILANLPLAKQNEISTSLTKDLFRYVEHTSRATIFGLGWRMKDGYGLFFGSRVLDLITIKTNPKDNKSQQLGFEKYKSYEDYCKKHWFAVWLLNKKGETELKQLFALYEACTTLPFKHNTVVDTFKLCKSILLPENQENVEEETQNKHTSLCERKRDETDHVRELFAGWLQDELQPLAQPVTQNATSFADILQGLDTATPSPNLHHPSTTNTPPIIQQPNNHPPMIIMQNPEDKKTDPDLTNTTSTYTPTI